MLHMLRAAPLALSLLLVAACGQADQPSTTSTAQAARLHVSGAQTPLPPTADMGAVYLTIHNSTGADDALVGARSEVAERVELHESVVEGGQATMRPVEEIPVPAGAEAVLERGGYHLMIINHQPLAVGDRYQLTLVFREAGEVQVEVEVVPALADMEMEGEHQMGEGEEGEGE